jgi:hypothetical protein
VEVIEGDCDKWNQEEWGGVPYSITIIVYFISVEIIKGYG